MHPHHHGSFDQPLRAQLEAFVDLHRESLQHSLDGLTEEQARRSLVPSRTTLLGLVKHATFVERVWFDEAVTGRSREQIGIPATPDESFVLDDDDTVASVQQAHREACEDSRRAVAGLGPTTPSTATGAGRCRCGGSSCTWWASWPSTPATPTSCASRCSRPTPVAELRRPPDAPAGSGHQHDLAASRSRREVRVRGAHVVQRERPVDADGEPSLVREGHQRGTGC